MSATVFLKLLAIFVVVAIGWIVGKLKWLGPGTQQSDPARTLSNAAFYIFVPALLFRTTSRIDFAAMPWGMLAAFVFYAALGLWAFHEPRLSRVAGVVWGIALLSGDLLFALGVRP